MPADRQTDPDAPLTDPSGPDLAGLSASIDRLTDHAHDWSTQRLLDEGLDLVRDACWADAAALFRVGARRAAAVHARPSVRSRRTRPGGVCAPVPDSVDTGWFPWGLAPLAADRFVLIDDARALPADPDGARTLGELGVRSCLHLPLRQRGRTVGALQVFWSEPRLAWDDDRGRLLRTLGRFLLTCDGRVRT